jgi:glycerate dehydrogenase
MESVAPDGHPLNPGALSWDRIEDLLECAMYDRTPADETVGRADRTTLALANKTVLSRDVILSLPGLECVGVLAICRLA